MQNTVYFGDRKVVLEEVKKELDLELRMNFGVGLDVADIFELQQMQIRVDDIRRMKSFCHKTSVNPKVIFLSSFYWSDEVQNAMLKVLEESPSNTFIYLFGLSQKYFLPTVLSRLQKVSKKNSNKYAKDAKEVLSILPNERLENKIVKKVLGLKVIDMDYEKNKENEKKDREAHILFLQALIKEILQNKNDHNKEFLYKLTKISELAEIEGGSPHMFIEWLLLACPQVKS